jgi:hypothetical protein
MKLVESGNPHGARRQVFGFPVSRPTPQRSRLVRRAGRDSPGVAARGGHGGPHELGRASPAARGKRVQIGAARVLTEAPPSRNAARLVRAREGALEQTREPLSQTGRREDGDAVNSIFPRPNYSMNPRRFETDEPMSSRVEWAYTSITDQSPHPRGPEA